MKKPIDAFHIYPLTIIGDRYNGVYSGGIFTAWNTKFTDIPEEVDESDLPCSEWWNDYRRGQRIPANEFGERVHVGLGDNPLEALENLYSKLQ